MKRKHKANKVIPFINEKGEREKPSKENGIKYEMFIFDVYPYCKKLICLEVERKEGEISNIFIN